MTELTSKERFARIFEHREADRVPVLDYAWPSTLERWRREGLPEDVGWVDYFGLDHVTTIVHDNSPRFEAKVLEETEDYVVHTTGWGATLKNWKHAGGTPDFLSFTITSPEAWQEAKPRMAPSRDRLDWAQLERNYRVAQERGDWVMAGLWFGFDVTHSWVVGTERLLMALMAEPEWCADMFNTFLDTNLAMLDMIWDEGYRFDCITWPDDLGYKGKQFVSLDTYRELIKPAHKRAADWAHARGVKVAVHSCGDVNPFIEDFVDAGIDCLNPLEVKAGMDPCALKERFGDELVLHGGVNAVLWTEPDAIKAEIERVVPTLKQNGGYIFASDHSIPDSVSFAEFGDIIETAKRVGAY